MNSRKNHVTHQFKRYGSTVREAVVQHTGRRHEIYGTSASCLFANTSVEPCFRPLHAVLKSDHPNSSTVLA